MPLFSSADTKSPPVGTRVAGGPAFPYDVTARISLWCSVVLAAALFAWGAWQRRWIADDGLIVLRTVRNLLAGNGPVFNKGERVESNTSTLWTYLNYLGGLDRRPDPARIRHAVAGPRAQRGGRRVPDARRGPAVRAEPAGPPRAAPSGGCAGLHGGAARPRLRHLGTRKRLGAGLSRSAVVDDGVLVAGAAVLSGNRIAQRGQPVLRRVARLRRRPVGAGSSRTRADRWTGPDHDADRRTGLAASCPDHRRGRTASCRVPDLPDGVLRITLSPNGFGEGCVR